MGGFCPLYDPIVYATHLFLAYSGSLPRMDWLKSIINVLPLDTFSDILGEIVIWWSQMVKDVPPADLPMYAYIGGAIVVLMLWVLVARVLPRPIGGITWVGIFAILFTPGQALDTPSTIAPASISVVYAVLMKDIPAAISNAVPVLVVFVVGLFLGFIWQLIRGVFSVSMDAARRHSAEDTAANMQFAGGNYTAEKIEAEPVVLEKTPKTPISAEPEVKLIKDSSAKDKVKAKIKGTDK